MTNPVQITLFVNILNIAVPIPGDTLQHEHLDNRSLLSKELVLHSLIPTMLYERGIITACRSGVDLVIEWKIENFFNLLESVGKCYCSPAFSFGSERWYLRIFLNGSSEGHSSGHVDLDFWKYSSIHSIKQSFSLSLKTVTGEKYNEQNVTKDFNKGLDYHSFNRFMPRLELTRRRSELMPEGVLTVVCTMKNSTTAGSTFLKWNKENCIEASKGKKRKLKEENVLKCIDENCKEASKGRKRKMEEENNDASLCQDFQKLLLETMI